MWPKTYLINLDDNSNRLEAMASQLRGIGMEYERVPAFDGRGLAPEAIATLPDVDINASVPFMGLPFNGREYGRYKSHLNCARLIVESGDPHALVFEDNVEMSPDLKRGVSTILDIFSANNFEWDIVNLGADRLKHATDIGIIDGSGRKLAYAHYFPKVANALLWSRRGALRFLTDHALVKMPVDRQFREYLTRSDLGFAVSPPLARGARKGGAGMSKEILVGRFQKRNWIYGLLSALRLISTKSIAMKNRKLSRKRIERFPFIDVDIEKISADGHAEHEKIGRKPLPIRAFLINLDSGKERLRTVRDQLNRAEIKFERVPAYDGRKLNIADLEEFADADTDAFLHSMGRQMYGAEYGCFKSHLDCLRRIVDCGDPYGLVIEDDVVIHPRLLHRVGTALEFLEAAGADWDVVNLSPIDLRSSLTTEFCAVGPNHALVRAHYFPLTTGALLWSRSGALNILTNHSTVGMPLDRQLREILTRSDRGYAVWPPLIQQNWNDSQIDIDGTMYRSGKRIYNRWTFGFVKKSRMIANRMIARRHRMRAILSRARDNRNRNFRRPEKGNQ